ncbi:hypothetical protein N9A04_00250 [Rickettsiales bacterium]|nr:hypothetical protein [Rickettsiales bacterium]
MDIEMNTEAKPLLHQAKDLPPPSRSRRSSVQESRRCGVDYVALIDKLRNPLKRVGFLVSYRY